MFTKHVQSTPKKGVCRKYMYMCFKVQFNIRRRDVHISSAFIGECDNLSPLILYAQLRLDACGFYLWKSVTMSYCARSQRNVYEFQVQCANTQTTRRRPVTHIASGVCFTICETLWGVILIYEVFHI